MLQQMRENSYEAFVFNKIAANCIVCIDIKTVRDATIRILKKKNQKIVS